MKKFLALVVSAAMVFSIATVSFAASKNDKSTSKSKVEDKVKPTPKPKPTKKPTPTPKPLVKKPDVKKPSKDGKFVVFQGTTTAKAHVRILVNNKTVASGQADKKGNFRIKVESKKLKSTVTVYAYTTIKGKIAKSDTRKVSVPVNLLPSPSPAPTQTPEATPTPEVTPVPDATPTPDATPVPDTTPIPEVAP